MGNQKSKPNVTVEEKELAEPWRRINWSTTRWNELKDFINNYKPSTSSVEKARILLVGQINSGKSSFFNSINSIYHGHITSQAITGIQGVSVTTQYHTYIIKDVRAGQPLPLFICDTMGLHESLDEGLKIEDIDDILMGAILDKHEFDSVRQYKTSANQMSETVKNRIHCVVYVVDISTVAVMSVNVKEKLKYIRGKVNLMGVPQMVILTKVDEACEIVKQDLRKVYHSIYIKDKIKEVSAILGISILDMVPVKNYSHEGDLDDNLDILLLSALQKMLVYANNYLDDVSDVKKPQN